MQRERGIGNTYTHTYISPLSSEAGGDYTTSQLIVSMQFSEDIM